MVQDDSSPSSRVFCVGEDKDLDDESRESVKGMGWTAVDGVCGGCQ